MILDLKGTPVNTVGICGDKCKAHGRIPETERKVFKSWPLVTPKINDQGKGLELID